MNKKNKEFLHSLHPLLPENLVPVANPIYELTRIPCCYILRDINQEISEEEDQKAIKLNDTGAVIWSLCDGKRPIGEINHLIASAYEVEVEEIGRDVSRVIDHLIEEKAMKFSASTEEGSNQVD